MSNRKYRYPLDKPRNHNSLNMKQCSACTYEYPTNYDMCPICGAVTKNNMASCKSCTYVYLTDESHCPMCFRGESKYTHVMCPYCQFRNQFPCERCKNCFKSLAELTQSRHAPINLRLDRVVYNSSGNVDTNLTNKIGIQCARNLINKCGINCGMFIASLHCDNINQFKANAEKILQNKPYEPLDEQDLIKLFNRVNLRCNVLMGRTGRSTPLVAFKSHLSSFVIINTNSHYVVYSVK